MACEGQNRGVKWYTWYVSGTGGVPDVCLTESKTSTLKGTSGTLPIERSRKRVKKMLAQRAFFSHTKRDFFS